MHWICPLYKLSTCWVFVEVLSRGVFEWPQQWLDMLSIPKNSQRLKLNHGRESEVYSSPQNTKMLGCTSSERTHWWGQKGKKRHGKTTTWIRRRSSKGCYNNIVKELMIEDTVGYKEMMRAIFDTLGTARAWVQYVERCCASALDLVDPHICLLKRDKTTRSLIYTTRQWSIHQDSFIHQDSYLYIKIHMYTSGFAYMHQDPYV